jgi:hypothetical protein
MHYYGTGKVEDTNCKGFTVVFDCRLPQLSNAKITQPQSENIVLWTIGREVQTSAGKRGLRKYTPRKIGILVQLTVR